jgi:hypothetical protein
LLEYEAEVGRPRAGNVLPAANYFWIRVYGATCSGIVFIDDLDCIIDLDTEVPDSAFDFDYLSRI